MRARKVTYRLLKALEIRRCLLLTLDIAASHREDSLEHFGGQKGLMAAHAVGGHVDGGE